MNGKKLSRITVFLIAVMLFTMLPACKAGNQGLAFSKISEVSGYDFIKKYTGRSDSYVCTVVTCEQKKLTIPAEYDGKPVVAVIGNRDSNDKLTEVVISKGIKYIEKAFCNYSALSKVSIPDSVIAINNSFNYCDKLTDVSYNGDLQAISANSFNRVPVSSTVKITKKTSKETTGRELTEGEYEELHKDDIEADIKWISGIWGRVLGDMVSAGEATSANNLHFALTSSGRDKYTKNKFSLNGKIICAGNYGYKGDTIMTYTRTVHDDQSLPYYYCAQIAQDSPKASFAAKRDECKYLIMILGVSSTEAGFYEGGADRTSVSTEVVIIDVEKKKVVHIEHIGQDAPGAITKTTKGRLKEADAMKYIASIL